MADTVRAFDWATTPLGPMADWSPGLSIAVAFVLEHPFPAVLAWGPEFTTIYNDRYSILLRGRPEALGRPFLSVWPEVRETIAPQIERARQGEVGSFSNARFSLMRDTGIEDAWFDYSFGPARDGDGTIGGVLYVAIETTERERTRSALEASEQRLKTLVEGVPQLVWRARHAGDWTWASPQWTAFTGQAEQDSHGRGWLDRVHPEDRDHALAQWNMAEGEESFEAEYRIFGAEEGSYRWFKTRAAPSCREDGTVAEWLGTSTDIQELKEAQDRQGLLLAELQHRVRNLLSMVRSVVRQSADGHDDVEEYVAHLLGRLTAMGRTQVMLTRAAGARINLRTLVWDELETFVGERAEIAVSGPEVELAPRTAEILTLAIHEMATNSIKYGALGNGGRIGFTWVRDEREGRAWLSLSWEEHVAKPLGGPAQGGFGTDLIERRIPYQVGGEGSLTRTADGVRMALSFPVTGEGSLLDTSANGLRR